jgi:hypothetical protein
MGKMNLLHVACDSGWREVARELLEVEGMDVNLPCPSPNMRPGNLTPLMLAAGLPIDQASGRLSGILG